MPLYEITSDSLRPIDESTFVDLKLKEREDIQRLLRTQIEVIGQDLYVLSEEFGDWEDSNRRIDLLAIDQNANLVVIELKRTNTGGHMELQAIRYASMISSMTFDKAVRIHRDFLSSMGKDAESAEQHILGFLNWDEADEENFATDVRIILASENFGKELTTAVLWLRDRDLDIQCIRLKPYKDGDQLLIDVETIIPLPEANAYQIQIKEKEQVGRKKKAERYSARLKFWQGVVATSRSQNGRHANIKPGMYNWLGASSGYSGLGFNFVVTQQSAAVELYFNRANEENEILFDALHTKKDVIEHAFGAPLSWERLDGKRACRIKFINNSGGYKSPDDQWPAIHKEMVTAMGKLELALLPELEKINI